MCMILRRVCGNSFPTLDVLIHRLCMRGRAPTRRRDTLVRSYRTHSRLLITNTCLHVNLCFHPLPSCSRGNGVRCQSEPRSISPCRRCSSARWALMTRSKLYDVAELTLLQILPVRWYASLLLIFSRPASRAVTMMKRSSQAHCRRRAPD